MPFSVSEKFCNPLYPIFGLKWPKYCFAKKKKFPKKIMARLNGRNASRYNPKAEVTALHVRFVMKALAEQDRASGFPGNQEKTRSISRKKISAQRIYDFWSQSTDMQQRCGPVAAVRTIQRALQNLGNAHPYPPKAMPNEPNSSSQMTDLTNFARRW